MFDVPNDALLDNSCVVPVAFDFPVIRDVEMIVEAAAAVTVTASIATAVVATAVVAATAIVVTITAIAVHAVFSTVSTVSPVHAVSTVSPAVAAVATVSTVPIGLVVVVAVVTNTAAATSPVKIPTAVIGVPITVATAVISPVAIVVAAHVVGHHGAVGVEFRLGVCSCSLGRGALGAGRRCKALNGESAEREKEKQELHNINLCASGAATRVSLEVLLIIVDGLFFQQSLLL